MPREALSDIGEWIPLLSAEWRLLSILSHALDVQCAKASLLKNCLSEGSLKGFSERQRLVECAVRIRCPTSTYRRRLQEAMSLSGRLALVTGGVSGIGEAVCHVLAAEGVRVVVADKQLELAKNVARSLTGDTEHQAMYVDVSDSSSVKELFSTLRDTFTQPLSIVVNSAGIAPTAQLINCTDEQFDDVIKVNLRGTFLVIREAGRCMSGYGESLPEGGASIVNIASIFAKSPCPEFGAYAASKAGIVALTKTAAQELARHGIRCNAVLPGFTETPLAVAVATAELKAEMTAATPLKRTAQPREIAEAIKFLCSPTASSFVTGAALEVAGGYRM